MMRLGTCSLLLVLFAACGGGGGYRGGASYARSSGYETTTASTGSGTYASESVYESESEPDSESGGGGDAPASEPSDDGGRYESASFHDEVAREELHRSQGAMIAQAEPARAQPGARPAAGESPAAQAQATATDAVDTSGPLLIYVATLHLAVYEVAESQARIVAAARELGGFVFAQSDDRVVVRVPAPRFDAMLGHVERAGDVEHRDVQAQDVSEEFHDVEIRIRNLEAMRTRVEALLAQARNVEEALQVEQQLARITQELERMRGRQRFLADRIAFSTITVLFRPRPRESIGQPDVVQLPFGWLENLGLSTLLELR